jgi:hypothetical protein
MKYRLVEMLRCPAHPDLMLRVTGTHLAELFPYGGDVQVPVCRAGCGLLGNWFKDIPESLPTHHRFDCRKCLGTEIETATLRCPDCDWSVQVIDGVLQTYITNGEPEIRAEEPLNRKVGPPIEKHLSLQSGEIVLVLAPIPDSMEKKWCNLGVERLRVEVNPEVLHSGRAIACANGQGLSHYLGGPFDTSILRANSLDAIVMPVPTDRVADFTDTLSRLPELLKPSGRAILTYARDPENRKSSKGRHELIMVKLPKSYNHLESHLIEANGTDLLLIKHPTPENGNGKSPA